MFGGGALAGMANAQSDFTGGRDTLATLLDGTTTSTSLNTTFLVTSLASNDDLRQSDVYTLDGVSPDGTYVRQLSAATVDGSSFLGWLDPRDEQMGECRGVHGRHELHPDSRRLQCKL